MGDGRKDKEAGHPSLWWLGLAPLIWLLFTLFGMPALGWFFGHPVDEAAAYEGLGALFTGLAFALALITLWRQQAELKDQRRILDRTADIQASQRAELAGQAGILERTAGILERTADIQDGTGKTLLKQAELQARNLALSEKQAVVEACAHALRVAWEDPASKPLRPILNFQYVQAVGELVALAGATAGLVMLTPQDIVRLMRQKIPYFSEQEVKDVVLLAFMALRDNQVMTRPKFELMLDQREAIQVLENLYKEMLGRPQDHPLDPMALVTHGPKFVREQHRLSEFKEQFRSEMMNWPEYKKRHPS